MVSLFVMAIIITSIATYLSRLLGVITSEKISEESKLFRWFNCLAYSTLAALIARIIVFPSGSLNETNFYLRMNSMKITYYQLGLMILKRKVKLLNILIR